MRSGGQPRGWSSISALKKRVLASRSSCRDKFRVRLDDIPVASYQYRNCRSVDEGIAFLRGRFHRVPVDAGNPIAASIFRPLGPLDSASVYWSTYHAVAQEDSHLSLNLSPPQFDFPLITGPGGNASRVRGSQSPPE